MNKPNLGSSRLNKKILKSDTRRSWPECCRSSTPALGSYRLEHI